MDNSDTIHKLADTTFRNVEELTGNLKKLVSVSRNLSKAMEDIIPLSEEFASLLDTIGSKTANLPGGIRNFGGCLKEMATASRKINASYADWATSLNTDLIVSLEDKLDREQPNLMKNWKTYKAEASKKESVTEKTAAKLKGLRKKKSTVENMEKENQLCQILEDQQQDLHSTRVEGLRKALIEQQKLHSFFIYHLCGVHHAHIAYSSNVYQTLSMKINSWSSIANNPDELPQESLVLLKNPHSPDAYKPPGINENESHFSFEDVDVIGQGSSSSQGGVQEIQQQQTNPVTAADIRNIKAEAKQPESNNRKRRPSCRVKAVHSFESHEPGRLNLKAGDLIDAISEEKDGWLYGSNSQTKQSGWFPSQYVDKVWWPTPELVHRTPPAQPKSHLVPALPARDYIQNQGTSPVIQRRHIQQNVTPKIPEAVSRPTPPQLPASTGPPLPGPPLPAGPAPPAPPPSGGSTSTHNPPKTTTFILGARNLLKGTIITNEHFSHDGLILSFTSRNSSTC